MPPDLSSFLWKMLLDLLCTPQRLHRMGASPSPMCKLCKTETGSLQHELLECSFNDNTGQRLLSTLQLYMPNMTANSLLHLSLADLDADKQLSSTILIAATLSCIWKERSTSSRVRTYQVRSEIEQTINLLRTTTLYNTAETLNTLLGQMFQ